MEFLQQNHQHDNWYIQEDCLTKVPLLVKPPKGTDVDPGISDFLAELVDFYATAMDFAGVTSDHTHFGKSLRPVLKDRSAKIRDYVFCEGGRMPGEEHCDESHINGPAGSPPSFVYWPRQTAQRGDDTHLKGTMIFDSRYKYIMRQDDSDEFYDLQLDSQEKTNRIHEAAYAGEITRLERQMLKWYGHEWRFWELCIQDALERFINPEKDSFPFDRYRI